MGPCGALSALKVFVLKASIGKSIASRCLWCFFKLKIWNIKIFCLFLPVVITNQVMRWRSIVDEMEGPKIRNRCYPLSQDGVTLRSDLWIQY